MSPHPSRPPEAQSSPSSDSTKSGRRKLQIVVGSRTAAAHACESPRDRRLVPPGTPDTKAKRRTRRQEDKLVRTLCRFGSEPRRMTLWKSAAFASRALT